MVDKIKAFVFRVSLLIPDRIFLMLKYKKNLGIWPNLKNPKTFNEKLNWLKLYDRNPLYTVMVDKYEAKKYVADLIGEEYIIPTFGVWGKGEDIDFDALPDKFVLKTTHDSGSIIICKDKSRLNKEISIREMNKSLKRNFYASTREWPYKNVHRRIIAEQLLENADNQDICDYKFFCFNGRVEFMKVDFDRFVDHHANYYDRQFRLLDFGERDLPPIKEKNIDRPVEFGKMIQFAETLSKECRFARVDFYEVQGRVYFGEITFYPASGVGVFCPECADYEIGKLLKI